MNGIFNKDKNPSKLVFEKPKKNGFIKKEVVKNEANKK